MGIRHSFSSDRGTTGGTTSRYRCRSGSHRWYGQAVGYKPGTAMPSRGPGTMGAPGRRRLNSGQRERGGMVTGFAGDWSCRGPWPWAAFDFAAHGRADGLGYSFQPDRLEQPKGCPLEAC